MRDEFYSFHSPGGKTPLYPPELQIPFLVRPKFLPEATCSELCSMILAKEKEIMKKNSMMPVAGKRDGLTTRWLSYNLLTWEGSAIDELKEVVKETYLQYLKKAKIPRWRNQIQCWANVLRDDEVLHPHYHNFKNRPVLSATVSLTTSPTETVYILPFALKKKGTSNFVERLQIPTQQGNIIMAPGWVTHFTSPPGKKQTRITLGLDISAGYDKGKILNFDSGKKFLL